MVKETSIVGLSKLEELSGSTVAKKSIFLGSRREGLTHGVAAQLNCRLLEPVSVTRSVYCLKILLCDTS